MMNLMGSPVSRKDISKFGAPAFGRQVRLVLGQDLTSATDLLKSLGEEIAALMKDLPPDAAGTYSNRLKACQDMAGDGTDILKLGIAAECMRKLYQEMKTAHPASPAVLPAPDMFPYVPVAIAAVGAAVLLAVVLTAKKGGKK
jgi:hypothetical protein